MLTPDFAETSLGSRPREHSLLTADGVQIYATERGAGDVFVVVAHCFSGGHHRRSHERVLSALAERFHVIAIDQRGHGKSGGASTLAHLEVLDVDAAVGLARSLGARYVVTLGFSMGASSVLRHAALANGGLRMPADAGLKIDHRPDAVAIMGGAGQWYYRGSEPMRRMHNLTSRRIGRWLIRNRRGVTMDMSTWPSEHARNRDEMVPLPPKPAAAALPGLAFLVLHGSLDDYFPVAHAEAVYGAAKAAGVDAELRVLQDIGHAESAVTPEVLADLSDWIARKAGVAA